MRTVEELREFFENDRYVKLSEIEIAEVSEKEASVRVALREIHFNAGGVAQGGLIFTLMDFAFGVHANRNGGMTVTQSASVSYIRPPKGSVLVAVAKPKGETRKTAVYEVSVVDEFGTAVAEGIFNGFRKENG